MNNPPTISVVIPVYNAGPFLREALDSLLAQTFGDFEAIAVNDGSTDNSLEILQEYAARDSRIRILDGPNGGYGKAMNRGMDAATGKYMAILEPDDFLPREAYAILIPLAEQHRLDVVRGTHCSFYVESNERLYQYMIHKRCAGDVFCPRKELPGVFAEGPHIWTGLYNLSFLREHEIRFHESAGASYQDTGFFFLSAAHAERYMISDSVTYMYRTDNPGSSVNNLGNKRYMIIAEYNYIQQRLKSTPSIWNVVRKQFYENRLVGILWVCENLPATEIPGFLEYASNSINDWALDEVMPFSRKRYEHMMAYGKDYEEGHDPVLLESSFLGGMIRKYMSEVRTEYRFMGIQIAVRRRILVPRRLNSGIVAMSDLVDEYVFLGIPVARKILGYDIANSPLTSVPAWCESRD